MDTKVRPPKGTVLLIHGLGGGPWLLKPLGRKLKQSGFTPVYFRYPVHASIERDVSRLQALILNNSQSPMYVVAHSFGALLTRLAFSNLDGIHPRRVVMIAPVNQGSTLARRWYEIMGRIPMGHLLMRVVAGPVPFQILPEKAESWPPCKSGVEIGLIQVRLPLWLRRIHPLLDGLHDASTTAHDNYIQGLKDIAVIRGEHNTVLFNPRLWRMVEVFLTKGHFPYE